MQKALGDNPQGPRKQQSPAAAALLLLPACLSLAGPERAAMAHGPLLSVLARCQSSAFTGMYCQDGTLHFNDTEILKILPNIS
ncbi:hypothetical protein AMECASPLE_023017 [Ameca splendens]|uniref:Uncharacterized protein n=1 Tax=Ameca splendens TaxID=208324 RepID=A0ABV0ZQ67_9TELE